MKRWLILLAACGAPAPTKVPGANIAPDLEARATTNACATDISYDGQQVAIRYRYTYDELGRLAVARGRYANGVEDRIDYEFDNLDHLQRQLYTRAGSRSEIVAQYSTLGDLLEYTLTRDGDVQHYVYTGFTDAGQPTREHYTADGETRIYQLDYDATGRIARVAPDDGGYSTIYTYDDAARTVTIDTGQGAYRGVIAYDESNRRVREFWDGTDPSVYASEDIYEWAGDRLQRITFRAGTDLAPHALSTVEIHTYSYNCP